MSTRALTKAESERVRDHLVAIVKEEGTQTAAARRVGISQQVLSRILAGDPTGYHVAKKVAALRGMSMDELLRMPPALGRVLQAHPERWSPSAIAAVRASNGVDRMAESDLLKTLDKAQAALAPILKLVR